MNVLSTFLVLLIAFLVNLIFVRYLWNNSLVKHVTILRPTTTLFETFLLALSLTIITYPAVQALSFSNGFVEGFVEGVKGK